MTDAAPDDDHHTTAQQPHTLGSMRCTERTVRGSFSSGSMLVSSIMSYCLATELRTMSKVMISKQCVVPSLNERRDEKQRFIPRSHSTQNIVPVCVSNDRVGNALQIAILCDVLGPLGVLSDLGTSGQHQGNIKAGSRMSDQFGCACRGDESAVWGHGLTLSTECPRIFTPRFSNSGANLASSANS